MPKTFINGLKVKKWVNDFPGLGKREVKKAFFNGQLVYTNEIIVIVDWINHNYPTSDLINRMLTASGGKVYNTTYRVVFQPGTQLVGLVGQSCILLDNNFETNTVIFENYGQLVGRGGIGGDTWPGYAGEGLPGNDAIIVNGNVKLILDNHGTISGGGGGGGGTGWFDGGGANWNCTGGGGAPYGMPGPNNTGTDNRYYGLQATYTQPGIGGQGDGRPAGTGGTWGSPGGNGIFKRNGGGGNPIPGGKSGAAIRLLNGATLSTIGSGYGDLRGGIF